MPSRAWYAVVLLGLLPAAVPASAFTIFPDRDNPRALIVLVERPYGDQIAFRALPKPYDSVVNSVQGPDTLSFRWKYAREPQEGMAFLVVDEGGRGTMQFEFWGDHLADGDTLAAAAVLVDARGKPMHTFYAKADFGVPGSGGVQARRRVDLALDRPAEWWREVAGVTFFYMKYFSVQRPDEEGVWRAMRRAVERLSKAEGTSQRG